MLILHSFIFIVSCGLLFLAGKLLIKNLLKVAHFLGWREFVIAFIIIALASSIPNLFFGITSALHNVPQLSFGDTIGGNLIDLTLVVALAILISGKDLLAESKMVQSSALFTIIIAVLPLFLIWDGILSRPDGLILILVFVYYIVWIFSKKERFKKVYESEGGSEGSSEGSSEGNSEGNSEGGSEGNSEGIFKKVSNFIKSLGKIILGILFLLLASEGMVRSASFFANYFNMPIILIGLLVVALGNAMPETYFSIIAAKKKMNWLILGDLMGAVIVPSTLVLGIVALICPIKIYDFSPFVIARFFFIISVLFFLIFVRTNRKITKKEAFFLLGIYVLFILAESSKYLLSLPH